eukprot:8830190-Heterocapsa_arctica.AAC.1
MSIHSLHIVLLHEWYVGSCGLSDGPLHRPTARQRRSSQHRRTPPIFLGPRLSSSGHSWPPRLGCLPHLSPIKRAKVKAVSSSSRCQHSSRSAIRAGVKLQQRC